jgi:catechol 2,3-dioxygenase-like lactoylglutathione lyase family enzyme
VLKKILHTGVAVPNLQNTIQLYKSLGFEVAKEFHKSDIEADVAMVEKGETTFELFQFNNPNHPQVQFIRNHIAIYSDDIEKDVSSLVELGYTLTIPITEGMVFRFAYVQDQSGTNYEIATEKS